MRYKLYANKYAMPSILIYEGDDLEDVKRHFEDVWYDFEVTYADIFDVERGTIVSYVDFSVIPRDENRVKKIGVKRERVY